MPRQDPFRFDFAISFSGAQRSVAQETADGLKKAGFTVFYDKDQVYELLGEDGEIYLRKLYSAEAGFYIVLVSREYDESSWTNVELNAIRSRESLEHEGVLIPVIVGSYRPKWLSREMIFFDLQESSVQALVEVLGKKVSLREDSTIGNVRGNASDCQVFMNSPDTSTDRYAHLTEEIESSLRRLGFRVKHSVGPRSTAIFPVVECTREDRLVGLQVKAVVDTLLGRYGPLEGELEGETQIQLETWEASMNLRSALMAVANWFHFRTLTAMTSPGKLILYL